MIRPLRGLVISALSATCGAATCPAAQAASPTTTECLSASEAALELRANHRLHEARAQLLTCASPTCPTDVRTECALKVEQINLAIPTIVFEASDRSGADVSPVSVAMDGVPLVARLEGIAVSVDPGEHRFRFEAPHMVPLEKALIIHEGEKERHERVVMMSVDAVATADSEPTPPSRASGPRLVEPPPASGARGWRSQRAIGTAVAAAGVTALAVGAGFGVAAISKWSNAKSECASGSCPQYTQALADRDAAVSAATASTIALTVGGLALATGAVLWLTAPAAAPSGASTGRMFVAPGAGPASAGIVLRGDF